MKQVILIAVAILGLALIHQANAEGSGEVKLNYDNPI